MRRAVRSLLAAGVLVAALAGAVLTPAPAAASEVPGAAAAVRPMALPHSGEVTGQPWSAPAVDVRCDKWAGQVSCVPNDTNNVKDRACFSDVRAEGEMLIVCTTTDLNQAALGGSGGQKLEYKWGCTQTWDSCAVMEGMAFNLAMDSLNVMMEVNKAISYNTDNLLWQTAVEEWSFWVWAVWFVLIGAWIFAITQAAVQGQRDDVVNAVVRGLVAIPLTQLTLWLFGMIVNAIDSMGWYILNKGDRNLFEKLQDAYWAGGEVFPGNGLLINATITIVMVVLLFVFTARNIGLSALIMVGPVAWMVFPLRQIGKEWLGRYLSAVASLIIAGPLTIGLLAWVINGFGAVSTLWDPRVWPFVLALLLIAFAPFAIFSLFSFVGGSVIDQAAASGGRAASGAGRSLTRHLPVPRLGQSPAGRPPGRPGGPSGRPTSQSGGNGGAPRRPQTIPAGTPAPTGQQPASPTKAPASTPTGQQPASPTKAPTSTPRDQAPARPASTPRDQAPARPASTPQDQAPARPESAPPTQPSDSQRLRRDRSNDHSVPQRPASSTAQQPPTPQGQEQRRAPEAPQGRPGPDGRPGTPGSPGEAARPGPERPSGPAQPPPSGPPRR